MIREWTDEKTGRTVRQLTDEPNGVGLGYFRLPRRLPDGRVLAWARGRHGRDDQRLLAIDADSGDVETLQSPSGRSIRLRESDGLLWYVDRDTRQLCSVLLPDGKPTAVAEIPWDLPGRVDDISCDGATLILAERLQDASAYLPPTVRNPDLLRRYATRPRQGAMWAYELSTGCLTKLLELDGLLPGHIDTSPTDPALVRFCHDTFDGQRIWTVRTDGTDVRKIRPQEPGEVVIHEFWWPDGKHIAYKYQDRRGDDTFPDTAWCEYAPVPTLFALASLDGVERYLSDPIDHYHTHIFVSADCRWLCGEGTESDSTVHAAAFSLDSTRIDFVSLATVHTEYHPFSGQHVSAGFSADARWLLFADTIGDNRQVCAVKVDL